MSTAPKYNAKEFDDLFKKMIAQTDERIAEQTMPEPTADDGYYDDEPLWSDTQTRIEQMNSIKGR